MSSKVKKTLVSTPNWKLLLAAGLFVVLLVGLELSNTTHIFHKRKAVSGTIPSTTMAHTDTSTQPGATNQEKSSNRSDSSATPEENGAKESTPTSGSGTLVEPYGTFVSNHRPSLSESGDTHSGEESVCITSPGASCYITFTKDGVTKKLDSQVADSKGTVYWVWDVKKAGFVDGSWAITATATLDGQSKTTNDSLDLVVAP